MKKIILNADLVLDSSNKTPGLTGQELLIVQNSVGGHVVTLAPGNDGVINVGRQPGCVTLLKYRNDDQKTYWTSEILTPELVINQPAKITNLAAYLVDSNGVKLRWSAPLGNPPTEVPGTRYRIFVSQSEIDPNYGVTDLPEFKQTMIPKTPGELEEIVVTQLIAGHKYYVTVLTETLIFGKTKLSVPSNVISFIAAANDQAGAAAATIIPLKPSNFYSLGLLFAKDEETGQIMKAENLADLTGIIDNQGVPEGTPNVGMAIVMYGLGNMPQYNRPSWDCIIDLEGAWNVDYLYVWLTRNGTIEVQSSLDGVNYDVMATLAAGIEQYKWSKVLVNNIFSQGIKYIKLAYKNSEHGIRGFLMYGKRSERGQILGKKYKRTVEDYPFDERMGTNAFLLESSAMVRKVSRHTRCYVEQDWIVGRENASQGAAYDGSGNVILTVDQVKYQFESQNIWNWDEKLAEFKGTGQKIMLSTNNAPVYLRPVGYERPDQAKPVDPGLNPVDITVTTNPQNYKHIARLAYNIAARFGSNPDADPQYIQLTTTPAPGFPTGDTLKVGLDLIESIEFRNEADAYWTQANGYHNAEEQAAIASAVYDGHKGALGPGMGVKAADPLLRLSMSSLAMGGNIAFVKRMMLWWDLNRGYGDYPIDIINIHHYNGSGGSQTVPVYSDVPSEGVMPEAGEFLELVHAWNDFRDRQLPTVELRITEIGYDEQKGGVYSPGYPSQADRSKHKGYWLTRTFLLGFYHGFDIINQYWFANTTVRLEDLNPNDRIRDVFITCGYTDGILAYNDWNRKPLVSYWYVSNLLFELAGYKLQHALNYFGDKQHVGTVFDTYNPKLMALAFKHKDTNDTLIVAWLASANYSTGYFKLYVHPSESTVELITIDQAEIRQQPGGSSATVNTDADVNGKFIDLMLSECPTIIKTKNIGTKKLMDPVNVEIEAISNSTVKLSWDDRNIGGNVTKIYQSLTQDQDFTEVVSEYIDNGEYIFTDLLEGTSYYFKIGFADGAVSSALSPTIGITTLSTLQAPDNLRVQNKSASSITLAWDYTSEEQAKIDEFEISRSLTANGIYTVIGTVVKTGRTFTNNGLTQNTAYYYKIRAKKDFGFSPYTFGLAATTDAESEIPPVLQTAKTNYAGDRIKLVFDRGIANPAGQHAGFSIVETIAGTPSYINPQSLALDPTDNKIVYIKLSGMVAGATSVITLSYDKTVANLQSTNNVKVESFNDVAVTNNKDNLALLSRKIQVNLTAADTLQGAGWNDVIVNDQGNATPADEQLYTKALKDINGVTTGIEFILPTNQDDNINTAGYITGEMHDENDPHFPDNTNAYGVGIANLNYGGATSLGIFQNLDNTKEYNLRGLFTYYIYNSGGEPRPMYYKDWQSPTYIEKVLPAQSIYLTSLKAITAQYNPHASGGGYPVVDNINTPKVGMNFRQSDAGVWLAALILEEVIPE